MADGGRFIRVSAVIVAFVVALLLVVGVCTVMAGPGPSTGASPAFPEESSSAVTWTRWVSVTPGTCSVFPHNLGGDPNDYAVELLFLDTDGDLGLNRRYYGGLEANGEWYGVDWQNLMSNTIRVCRRPSDDAADRIRVRVWDPPVDPDYASPWTDINQGDTLTFTHGLGITATDLTVGLWFSSPVRGIHHIGYGGLADDVGSTKMLGGHWDDLTTNTVQVSRHPHDLDIHQVRVIVTHGGPPHYDSLVDLGGWQSIAAGDRYTFTHNLSWSTDLLLVRGECYSSTFGGISQLFAGGNQGSLVGWQGTYMRNLTSRTVVVVREADDQVCPQVRVRIWKRGQAVHLPLVLRDYAY